MPTLQRSTATYPFDVSGRERPRCEAMKERKHLAAAITAAIAGYIGEEEARRVAPAKPLPIISWSLFGRQEMMRMRTLWQSRAIPRRLHR